MSEDVVIRAENISKTFKLPHEKNSSIKSAIVNFYKRNKGYETQEALKDISFEIKKGEFFGIVGRNGSGKSTLLKILAGIYAVDSGKLEVNGTLTPFIELGVGFNQELTGRENIFLNGALLGFDRATMSRMYDDIVKFAELERFMDQKLKNYSSGMQVRLAFSIAIRAESDILLIDEVLAVGDALFQQKCYDYFDKLKKSGKTVVFISHDMGAIQSFCDRAMLINDGIFIEEGKPPIVTKRYSDLLAEKSSSNRFENQNITHTGTGGAEITKCEIINSQGKPTEKIKEEEGFSVRIHYTATKNIPEPTLGIGIMGEKGESIIGPNTKDQNIIIKQLHGKGYFQATFNTNMLSSGVYSIRAGIFNTSNVVPYDFVENLAELKIVGEKRYGYLNITPSWKIEVIEKAENAKKSNS